MFAFLISFLWWQFLVITVMSSGYHRYFSHQSFEAPLWYEFYVLILGPLSGALSCLLWAGIHRMHHAEADTSEDPHSPAYVGFWPVFLSTFSLEKLPRKYTRDLAVNPRIMFFHKHRYKLKAASLLLLLLILPLKWFLVFAISPMLWGYLAFGLVNTIGHRQGFPENTIVANILTPGEGNHAYHHKHPNEYYITPWWDPTAWFINLIRTNN